MKVVFMGTPVFAAVSLNKLIESGYEISAVITQPDKPKGRGGHMTCSPVKEKALEHGIAVYTPKRIRNEEEIEVIRGLDFDVIVVAAFGQILPKEILDMPKYGCINVHSSLLPKYRGAAPIQWAVINGDKVSGVTIMKMDEGLDTGDILMQRELELAPKETGGSLFDKLAALGADLLIETLKGLEAGSIVPVKQNEAESSYVGMLKKEDGSIDFSKSAASIERLIRGVSPWPGAYTKLNGRNVKIWDTDALSREEAYEMILKKNDKSLEGSIKTAFDKAFEKGAGTVAGVNRESIFTVTGDGVLKINMIQPEGKKCMDCGAFLRGYPVKALDMFEERV